MHFQHVQQERMLARKSLFVAVSARNAQCVSGFPRLSNEIHLTKMMRGINLSVRFINMKRLCPGDASCGDVQGALYLKSCLFQPAPQAREIRNGVLVYQG
ncbi:MAG: hypothetical protein WAN92_09540 [Herbaspirillum sp.]